jgi:hypothetical protein
MTWVIYLWLTTSNPPLIAVQPIQFDTKHKCEAALSQIIGKEPTINGVCAALIAGETERAT